MSAESLDPRDMDGIGRRGRAWETRGGRVSHLGGGEESIEDTLLLDSREVSNLLGIGRTKAYELMAREQVPVLRIGRSVRVPRAALVAWISANTALAEDQ